MKRLKTLIIALLCIATSFTLVACGSNNPPPQTAEYYEIEYQDGTGTHIAKATQTLKITEIKVYSPSLGAHNILEYTEWEYSNKFNLCIQPDADKPFRNFISSSTQNNFGSMSIYYDDDIENYIEWWNFSSYRILPYSTGDGYFINANGLNIIVNSRSVTHFNFYQISNNDAEFRIEAMNGNNILKTENVRIAVKLDYDYNKTWQKITLKEDGEFTSIIKNGETITTIRTENILRKVSV